MAELVAGAVGVVTPDVVDTEIAVVEAADVVTSEEVVGAPDVGATSVVAVVDVASEAAVVAAEVAVDIAVVASEVGMVTAVVDRGVEVVTAVATEIGAVESPVVPAVVIVGGVGPAVVLTTTVDDVEAPGVEVGAVVVAESVSVAVDRELVAVADTCVIVVGI